MYLELPTQKELIRKVRKSDEQIIEIIERFDNSGLSIARVVDSDRVCYNNDNLRKQLGYYVKRNGYRFDVVMINGEVYLRRRNINGKNR